METFDERKLIAFLKRRVVIMKSKKIFVSLTLVFSMVVMLLPYNVNACVMAKNTEGLNDSSDNSDAVLAYYDVKTQTETLFTEKDLQDTISRAKK